MVNTALCGFTKNVKILLVSPHELTQVQYIKGRKGFWWAYKCSGTFRDFIHVKSHARDQSELVE